MRSGWWGLLVGQAALLACSCSTACARDVVVTSFDGTPIVAHFYPAATPGERTPTVLLGIGYGFRGPTTPDQFGTARVAVGDLRRAGYNVVTWDPRGFGGSGGTSMFDSVAFEARDVQALVDYVALQPEALLDAPGDPRVGMVGASYGGGIQFAAGAIEPRLDALAPDVAWNSLVNGFARDRAFKAGWLVQLCAVGALYGVLDGVTDGLIGPAGLQLGTVDVHFTTMCAEGALLGSLSAASTQWLAGQGPGSLVSRIRAPTLLTQGTIDTLFPPGEAVANYALLRAAGVPVKMMWSCSGHGTCLTPAGDPAVAIRAKLAWLQRWLKRDTSVDTGPAFEWIDDAGTWRSAPDYPLASAGSLGAVGAGSMTVLPSVTVTQGATAITTPPSGILEMRYARPTSDQDIVGEPALTLTYRGFALPFSTFVYAQVVDAAAGRIAGNQVTPIPVVLDGLQHTVTRKLEVIALRGRPTSDLRLQLVTSTPLYGPQRSAGTIAVSSMTSTLPLVDAALPAARPTATPPPPAAVAAPASPIGDLLGRLRRLVGIGGR